MAATAKYPNLKPADPGAGPGLPSTNVVRPEFDAARRRLSVSEKLAEGRGFWRGLSVGASIGTVAGVAGSIIMMNVLTPSLTAMLQQGMIASMTFGPTMAAETGTLTTRPAGEQVAASGAKTP